MKYRIETAKPNIYKKSLKSEILNKQFKLWITMKTRKCIMKAGSFDNYLLTTKPIKLIVSLDFIWENLSSKNKKILKTLSLDIFQELQQAKDPEELRYGSINNCQPCMCLLMWRLPSIKVYFTRKLLKIWVDMSCKNLKNLWNKQKNQLE